MAETSKKRKLDDDDAQSSTADSNPKPSKRAKTESDDHTANSNGAPSPDTPSAPKPDKKESVETKPAALELDASLPLHIVFLTGNEGKLREVQNYLGDDLKKLVTNHKLDLEEVQGTEEQIATHKLHGAKRAILEQLGHKLDGAKPLFILVEDTSLWLDHYSSPKFNFPGPFCKFLLRASGVRGYLDMVKGHENRSCTAQCLFGFLRVEPGEGAKPLFFKGECHGVIPMEPRGDDGFGWDPIFEFAENKKTFAEMTVEEKNKISHRANALKKLRAYLETEILPLTNKKGDDKKGDDKKENGDGDGKEAEQTGSEK